MIDIIAENFYWFFVIFVIFMIRSIKKDKEYIEKYYEERIKILEKDNKELSAKAEKLYMINLNLEQEIYELKSKRD